MEKINLKGFFKKCVSQDYLKEKMSGSIAPKAIVEE